MNILEDIGGELQENETFSVNMIKKLEAQHWLIVLQICLLQQNPVSDLFAPSQNKVAENLQELPTTFLPVINKHPFDSGLSLYFCER